MKTDNSHYGTHSPEYALLGFLFQQPGYGYNLHQTLVTELGYVWHVSQSQTYAILKRLVTHGFLSATIQDQEKLPSRQLLQLTSTGRRQFKHWLVEPTGSSVRAIRLEFVTRLYFAKKFFPDKLIPMLVSQTGEVDAAIDRLDKIRSAIPPDQTFNRMGLELRIRQLGSIKTWLVECYAVLGIDLERTP